MKSLNTPHPSVLDDIEDLLAAFRRGGMVIVVDDEGRENEGDLICAADRVTPEIINFMITHGRGLVCLALDEPVVRQLSLNPMSGDTMDDYQTAWMESIDARDGVTTGISASDRAKTITKAIQPGSTRADFRIPGHLFTLRAAPGGVLERAGHTEAAVDLARLAGFSPAGVICEIIRDDGEMARLPDLLLFGKKHGIPVGSIEQLQNLRRNG